jgi:hypothetical protein
MAELGVLPHVIEAVLNHSSGSKVSRIYNRFDHGDAKAAALARWADHVLGRCDSKIVPLRKA